MLGGCSKPPLQRVPLDALTLLLKARVDNGSPGAIIFAGKARPIIQCDIHA